ncbi:hypothetical protein LCGC14_0614050 [marine sediment metagenome]|uniref:Uncharacterized protein n=1 Tax=marine sediment metagenome TaxID=412755 RepID=A0A0F9R715_9ZZZZ
MENLSRREPGKRVGDRIRTFCETGPFDWEKFREYKRKIRNGEFRHYNEEIIYEEEMLICRFRLQNYTDPRFAKKSTQGFYAKRYENINRRLDISIKGVHTEKVLSKRSLEEKNEKLKANKGKPKYGSIPELDEYKLDVSIGKYASSDLTALKREFDLINHIKDLENVQYTDNNYLNQRWKMLHNHIYHPSPWFRAVGRKQGFLTQKEKVLLDSFKQQDAEKRAQGMEVPYDKRERY